MFFSQKNLINAFWVSAGIGLYVVFVDPMIPAQLALPSPGNQGG